MKTLKMIVERLKNPVVLVSIGSQILVIVAILKRIDADMITNASVAISSLLVSLGIINNPAKETVTSTELHCDHCDKDSVHVLINGKYLCAECGCEFQGQCPIDFNGKKIIK